MNHIKHSPLEQVNKDNSMEGEEDKGIERLDASFVKECSVSQKGTSVSTDRKWKSFSGLIPEKISLDNGKVKQKDEHSSVNETGPCKDLEITSEFSTDPPIFQMAIVDSLDNSYQAVNGNASTKLANDETDYSKGNISTDSIPEIGAVSYPNRATHSFLDYDVAKGKITQHPDTEGLQLDTEDPSSDTERTSSDTERASSDTERASSDTERTLSDTKGHRLKKEGKSLKQKGKSLKQKGNRKIQKGQSLKQKRNRLKQKGNSLIQKGNYLIQKGNYLIQKGNHLMRKGNHLMRKGKRLIQREHRMVQMDHRLM